jgi:peptidoglycan/xylan/chitin deacetylase (PgdA/CDA1 family)
MAKGEDARLIKFLAAENIPATLFVCGEWIDKYPAVLKKLAANPLFEIANRGLSRKACSVNGRAAEGTPGTSGIEDLFNEIERNARKIEAITGTLPHYYRAGAGYYDEIAVRIVKALGYEALGSSIRLPGGKEAGKRQVLDAFRNPTSGAIAILGGVSLQGTFVDGVMESVQRLRSRGYKFVKVSDYPSG